MTDILLIQPPIRDFYLTSKRTIPYGLACIASALMGEGFTVEILDGLASSRSRIVELPAEMGYLREYYGKRDVSPFGLFHHFRHFGHSFQHLGETVRRSGAFLVGISSLFTAYSDEVLETARVVKRFHPRCTLVVGGHHATEMPEAILACGEVDYVLRGEGEVSMPKLARALKDEVSVESVPGIVLRRPAGGVMKREPAVMKDLGRYPPPAFQLIKHKYYRRGAQGSFAVVGSRGCPLKCTYCSVGRESYTSYRRKSVEAVLHEIQTGVTQYEAGFIDFEDENISMDRDWFLGLLAGIRERFGGRGLELRAMNGLFPPTLDEEVVRAMKDAGFKTLNLSLGSTSPVQLKRFGRPNVVKAFDGAVTLAKKNGLQAVGYIIVGAAGQDPWESLGDLLYFAQKPVLVGVSVYYPSPGSADFKRCLEAGILPEPLCLMRSTAYPLSHSTARVQAVTLMRLGRILNFIKSLQNRGENILSTPMPVSMGMGPVSDRVEAGKILLGAFLHDGLIRGVTPQGEVYPHETALELSHEFVLRLKRIL